MPGLDGGSERLVVNEIAPRVHNSGHWTLGGAVTSQFEQHVRAICGWPLGETRRWGAIEMRNLIGDDVQAWRSILSEPGASLHVYGKTAPKPGRKMGHVTVVRPQRTRLTRFFDLRRADQIGQALCQESVTFMPIVAKASCSATNCLSSSWPSPVLMRSQALRNSR